MFKIYLDCLGPVVQVSVGSQALILGAMQIIKEKYNDVHFNMISAAPELEDQYLRGYGFNYTLHKRPKGVIASVRLLRKIVNAVDAVVCPWGDGYISTSPHVSLRKTLCLKKRNVPMMLFTSSMGPFKGRLNTYLAKMSLRNFDILTVRDTVTYKYFRELGFDKTKCYSDSAFVLKPSSRDRVSEIFANEKIPLKAGGYICINPSILLYARMKAMNIDYISLIVSVINKIKKISGKPIILVPHQIYGDRYIGYYNCKQDKLESESGDDRCASKFIIEEIDSQHVYSLNGCYSASDYKGIISNSEIFIGGRMHTVIGATSVCVPSLIMQYSHKAYGLMEYLGLQDYVWKIDDPVEKLHYLIGKLWRNRFEYRRYLEEKIPDVVEQAYAVANLLNFEQGH